MTETEVRDEMHIDLADALRVPASSFTWKEMLAMASSDFQKKQRRIDRCVLAILRSGVRYESAADLYAYAVAIENERSKHRMEVPK